MIKFLSILERARNQFSIWWVLLFDENDDSGAEMYVEGSIMILERKTNYPHSYVQYIGNTKASQREV